ncbi:MAG: 50S ribosomal protein LX [Euryarchaeota archaeon]|nr:50S ribosomal protein LX [Euryarchaeota archaeon]
MRAFRAVGAFRAGDRRWQKFSIEIAAEDEEDATQRVLSNLGSRHRVNRRNIEFKEIVPIEIGDISDPVVRYLAGGTR